MDASEEQAIPTTEVVEAKLSVRYLKMAVLWTPAMTVLSDITGPTPFEESVAIVSPEIALFLAF